MKKYYIRAYYGEWKEVTKEKADKFINYMSSRVVTPKTEEHKKAFIQRHYKEVTE